MKKCKMNVTQLVFNQFVAAMCQEVLLPEPKEFASVNDMQAFENGLTQELDNKNVPPVPSRKRRRRNQNSVQFEGAWKKNSRKIKRLAGLQYKNRQGKVINARSVKDVDCSKCRLKCTTVITQEQRNQLFERFWDINDYTTKRQYLVGCVKTESPLRCRTAGPSRKTGIRKYSFTINEKVIKVCRLFFLKTLDISEQFLRTAIKKAGGTGVVSPDNRGRQPVKKIAEVNVTFARQHILSFPQTESHCRKQTTRRYLDEKLNVAMMYRLYKGECSTHMKIPIAIHKYREIFHDENLAFHKPKKNQCKKCVRQHLTPVDREKEKQI